jgi:acyl-CoA synthetase (AMP-forming)/AMP-acid ligase II
MGRRDRVVLLTPEDVELAAALLGTTLAAIAVPVNAALTAAELDTVLNGLGAAAALVSAPPPAPLRERLTHHGVSVLKIGGGDVRKAGEAWLGGEAPRRIWFVPDVPRPALGKVQRSELRRVWLELHPATASPSPTVQGEGDGGKGQPPAYGTGVPAADGAARSTVSGVDQPGQKSCGRTT